MGTFIGIFKSDPPRTSIWNPSPIPLLLLHSNHIYSNIIKTTITNILELGKDGEGFGQRPSGNGRSRAAEAAKTRTKQEWIKRKGERNRRGKLEGEVGQEIGRVKGRKREWGKACHSHDIPHRGSFRSPMRSPFIHSFILQSSNSSSIAHFHFFNFSESFHFYSILLIIPSGQIHPIFLKGFSSSSFLSFINLWLAFSNGNEIVCVFGFGGFLAGIDWNGWGWWGGFERNWYGLKTKYGKNTNINENRNWAWNINIGKRLEYVNNGKRLNIW